MTDEVQPWLYKVRIRHDGDKWFDLPWEVTVWNGGRYVGYTHHAMTRWGATSAARRTIRRDIRSRKERDRRPRNLEYFVDEHGRPVRT